MNVLENVEALMVTQNREMGEMLTGFEGKNSYEIADSSGNQLYGAFEEGGSFLVRTILKATRPFTISIRDMENNLLKIKVVRPFRFYFHEVAVYDEKGTLLGSVKKKFCLVRRKYAVLDPQGRELYEIRGPLLHPWTFNIIDADEDGREYGKITKKWSGFLKESMTDADNFGVMFPADWNPAVKSVLLGAVFLIDFMYFENKD